MRQILVNLVAGAICVPSKMETSQTKRAASCGGGGWGDATPDGAECGGKGYGKG